MSEFHFIRPAWLLALIPLLGLLWWRWHGRHQGSPWRGVCDAALLPFVLAGGGGVVKRLSLVLLAGGGFLAIVALAGPAWNKLPQPLFKERSALVIALDLSRSMDAADIKPSRLTRARHKISDLLRLRREGETALLVYAAQPFVVTPLTDDNATIAAQVESLTTDIMPTQGSRPRLALEKGVELLRQAGKGSGELLLISDGIPPESADQLADSLPLGIKLSVLGIGTGDGAPIPEPGGGFLKDGSGAIVVPKLAETELRRLALRGGGRYATVTHDDSDIDHLVGRLQDRRQRKEEGESDVMAEQWREEGPWLILLLLPVAALAFRRGGVLVVLALLLPPPKQAWAWEWRDLWSRSEQQAAHALERGEHQQAEQLFSDPRWKAVANYRAGNYQQSAQQLRGVESADGQYNRGNALARQGNYPEALQAYQRALTLNPQHEDARHNLELVQQQMRQQGQQGEEGQPGERQQGEQKQQGDQQPGKPGQQGEQAQSRTGEQGEEHQGEEPREQAARKADQEGQGEEKPVTQEAQQEAPDEVTESVAPSPKEGEEMPSEEQLATELWLKRIEDDPGGLLRRKFRYQYRARGEQANSREQW